MLKYALKRLVEALPVLLVIITVAFFMVRLAPGGPFSRERQLSPEATAAMEAHYGLDKPLLQQYFSYLGNLCRGDLGYSFKNPTRTVNEIIANKIPVSLELGLWALLVALAVGVANGIVASVRPNSWSDYLPMSAAMVGICLPTFVIGPLLGLFFALHLGWLPVSGWEGWQSRVLPSLTLGLYYAAYIARLTRGSMLEVNNQDYIRTARAKGLPPWQVFGVHALRNALVPVVNYLGPALAGMVSGSFVIETIFNVPGLGRYFVQSAFNRDYFLVQGTVIVYATLLISLNLVVDLIQMWINPKQKAE